MPHRTGKWTPSEVALRELDHQFFRVRFDRVTPAEREYMRGLAELGEGEHRSDQVAESLFDQFMKRTMPLARKGKRR